MGTTVGYLHVELGNLRFTDTGTYAYTTPFSSAMTSCESHSDDTDCVGSCGVYWGLSGSGAGGEIVSACNALGTSDYSTIQMIYGFTIETDNNDGYCAAAASPAPSWDKVARVYDVNEVVQWTVDLTFSSSIMDELFTKTETITMDGWDYGDRETFYVQLIRDVDPSFELQGNNVGCVFPDGDCSIGHETLLVDDNLGWKFYGESGTHTTQIGSAIEVSCMDGASSQDTKCQCVIKNGARQWTDHDWLSRGAPFQSNHRCVVKPTTTNPSPLSADQSWCRDSTYKTEADCTTNCKRDECWVTKTPVAPATLSLERSGCGGVKFYFNAVFKSEYTLGSQDPGVEAESVTITASGCKGGYGGLKLSITSSAAGRLFVRPGTIKVDWTGHVGGGATVVSGSVDYEVNEYTVNIFTPQSGTTSMVVVTLTSELDECEVYCPGGCDDGQHTTNGGDDNQGWEWWVYLIIGVCSLVGLIVLILVVLCIINGSSKRKVD
jgi:hypothetical protein